MTANAGFARQAEGAPQRVIQWPGLSDHGLLTAKHGGNDG